MPHGHRLRHAYVPLNFITPPMAPLSWSLINRGADTSHRIEDAAHFVSAATRGISAICVKSKPTYVASLVGSDEISGLTPVLGRRFSGIIAAERNRETTGNHLVDSVKRRPTMMSNLAFFT